MIITTRSTKDISVHLSKREADDLIDQFYDLCSGNVRDNCFEITLKNDNGCVEHTLIVASEIVSVQMKEGDIE